MIQQSWLMALVNILWMCRLGTRVSDIHLKTIVADQYIIVYIKLVLAMWLYVSLVFVTLEKVHHRCTTI